MKIYDSRGALRAFKLMWKIEQRVQDNGRVSTVKMLSARGPSSRQFA